MLIDHEIRVAQVFHIEGGLDEAKRQEILTKTRKRLQKLISQIEVEFIEAIYEAGGKSAGKIRSFVSVEPYEHPIEAEWEPVNVQEVLHPDGKGTSNPAVQLGDDTVASGRLLEGGTGYDVESSEVVGSNISTRV